MTTHKIVITGGPGTGKTAIIEQLKSEGFKCFEEISRQVTLDAQKQGIDQLFLVKPLLFSEMLLEGRIRQFLEAQKMQTPMVFLDRGIPDILAYMNYLKTSYPEKFVAACKTHRYDRVFILSPWQDIFESDNERYESFEQALIIHDHLVASYQGFGYNVIDIPFGDIKDRSKYIINSLKK